MCTKTVTLGTNESGQSHPEKLDDYHFRFLRLIANPWASESHNLFPISINVCYYGTLTN